MATAPTDRQPASGRVDHQGRLVSADPRIEALQTEAGSRLGNLLAVPQLAAICRLASDLQTTVCRPAVAASVDRDHDLSVRAVPDESGVTLFVDGWSERPAAGPRLAAMAGEASAVDSGSQPTWAVNERLQLINVSQELADQLDLKPEEAIGQPLTRLLRLEEDDDGDMPLLSALAARGPFAGQRVRARRPGAPVLLLSGDIATDPSGTFTGLAGTAQREQAPERAATGVSFDQVLDEALRSPLDRIIKQAEQIIGQPDGPLRPDYAAYGTDIATAAQHLLSVIRSMSAESDTPGDVVDLADLSEEAVVMLESAAEERAIFVQLQASRALPARADRRAVIQILVNLIGNAIRHSPEGGHVDLYFTRRDSLVCVSVEDQGPGVPTGDEERIFERFERATDQEGGTGLGLAIASRLARAMGGDVTLDQRPGKGARFTLCLPEA